MRQRNPGALGLIEGPRVEQQQNAAEAAQAEQAVQAPQLLITVA